MRGRSFAAALTAGALLIGAAWWFTRERGGQGDGALPWEPQPVPGPAPTPAVDLPAVPVERERVGSDAPPVANTSAVGPTGRLSIVLERKPSTDVVVAKRVFVAPARAGYPPNWMRTAVSGSEGRVDLGSLPAEHVRVLVDQVAVDHEVLAGQRSEMHVLLEPAARLLGRTIDATGRSVGHAQLLALRSDADLPVELGESDNSGRFDLRGVASGTRLFARARERRPSAAVLVDPFLDRPGPLELILSTEGVTLIGQILDSFDAPVDGAVVCVEAASSATPALLQSDDEGRFTFHGLVGGPCVLLVRAGTLAAHEEALQLVRGGRNECIVRLAPGGAVSGRVTRDDGTPAAQVSIEYRSLTSALRIACTSDAVGEYSLRGLPAGRMELLVDGRQRATVEIQAGRITRLDPRLRAQHATAAPPLPRREF